MIQFSVLQSLFQVGEFAFVLSKVGIEYGLLTASMNQYFLAVSITSMLLTPFVFIYSERGIPILFGHASQAHILESVHIRNARAIVVAISDYVESKNIVRAIRAICKTAYLAGTK